ncbi:MAG: hypothetical protein R2850_06245 [Bacteroidia bacterium]
MTDDKLQNIDRLFKSQFDQIEVKFNPEHWSSLKMAMLTADVSLIHPDDALTASSTSKLFKYLKWISGLSIFLIAFGLSLYFLKPDQNTTSRPEPVRIEQNGDKPHSQLPDKNTIEESEGVNKGIIGNSSVDNYDEIKPVENLQSADSSTNVVPMEKKDSLENFIFW